MRKKDTLASTEAAEAPSRVGPVFSITDCQGQNVQEASLRREISMNCLMSETSRGMVGNWVRYANGLAGKDQDGGLRNDQASRRATSGEAPIVRAHLAIRV